MTLAHCTPDANFVRAATSSTANGGAAGGGGQPSGGGGQGGGPQGGGGQGGGQQGGGGQGPAQVLKVLKSASFGGNGDDVLTAVTARGTTLRIAGYSNSDPVNIDGVDTAWGGNDALLVTATELFTATTKSFGYADNQEATALATTADDKLFIAGNFADKLTFGGDLLKVVGSTDGFFGWLDAKSDHIASDRFGGVGTQIDVRAAATRSGTTAAILGGGFTGTDVSFDGGNCTLQGNNDLFLAGFAANATTATWCAYFSGAATNALNAVAANSDHLYAVGSYNMLLSPLDLPVAGSEDGFVAHFDPEKGTSDWAKAIPGTSAETPLAAAIMADDLLVAGRFFESIELDSTYQSAGSSDLFVARFAYQNGKLKWGKVFGDQQEQEATAMATEPNGSAVVVAGTFRGSIDFGSTKLTAAPLSKALFVVVLSANTGEPIASIALGDAMLNDAEATSITYTPAGEIVVVGWFSGTLVLDGSTQGPSSGKDMFVIKLELDQPS